MLYVLFLLCCHDNVIFAQETKEYCQLEEFRALCKVDHVILLHSAVYGRMHLGRCVKRDYGSLGCSTDVTAHVDRLCSGRPSCQFQVATLHVVNSCPGDLTPFLEARFTCVSVTTNYDQKCLNNNPLIINLSSNLPPFFHTSSPFTTIISTTSTTPSASATLASKKQETPAASLNTSTDLSPFLSSYIASNLGRGGSECPWQLKVMPGQQVNFTLFNFASVPAVHDWSAGGFSPSKPCHNFAIFRERQSSHVLTQCQGSARVSHAYLSLANVVEVEFRLPKSSDQHFLLHYKAVGCSNPPMVQGATFKRSGEFGIMRCNSTQEVHRLHCVDSRWKGLNCSWSSLPLSNYSPTGHQVDDFWGVAGLFSQESFPYSILLVVSIGVALGVFIGGVLLVCTTKFLKRRRSDNDNSLLQLHRHDYSMTPQHQSVNSPYPPSVHNLPPHHLLHHHRHHTQQHSEAAIYRSGDKLAALATRDVSQSEPCDVVLTQLKSYPCDIQLHKLLLQQQDIQQHDCTNDGDYFYAPRHNSNCRLVDSIANKSEGNFVATSPNVACTGTGAFYGEVLQATTGDFDHQDRKHLIQGGRFHEASERLTQPTSAGTVCAGSVTSSKLRNCPIDFA